MFFKFFRCRGKPPQGPKTFDFEYWIFGQGFLGNKIKTSKMILKIGLFGGSKLPFWFFKKPFKRFGFF